MPTTISEGQMATTNTRSIVLIVVSLTLVLAALYLIDPTFFGLLTVAKEGFEGTLGADSNSQASPGQTQVPGSNQKDAVMTNPHNADEEDKEENFKDASGNEGFANIEDVSGPAAFDNAQDPAGCYPRDQLTPAELLPKDGNSTWAQQNPMGTGSLKGKNFLSAGALIGVNTVGQTLRNANYQLRSEPANPQVAISVFNNSTIQPDTNRRDLEIA